MTYNPRRRDIVPAAGGTGLINRGLDMKPVFKGASGVLALLCVALAAGPAWGEGTTERERTMSRYQNCKWTDAMSKQIYECVKANNGFNTHWCFDETLQTNCAPDAQPALTVKQEIAPATVAPAVRQGEENLRGTIEREKTMLKYKDCKWTDEMGKYVYECVKRQNGFGVHWCHDEAIQIMCPDPAKPKS